MLFNEQSYQSSNKYAFCYLCASNRYCRHMQHRGICRNKTVSNSQKKHQFHISFFLASEPADKYKVRSINVPLTSTNIVLSRKHTNQTDVSYTNVDTNSSHKNSLHLLQTTTLNRKAKQRLTCTQTFSLVHFLF